MARVSYTNRPDAAPFNPSRTPPATVAANDITAASKSSSTALWIRLVVKRMIVKEFAIANGNIDTIIRRTSGRE
jgi:hypothetical protein